MNRFSKNFALSLFACSAVLAQAPVSVVRKNVLTEEAREIAGFVPGRVIEYERTKSFSVELKRLEPLTRIEVEVFEQESIDAATRYLSLMPMTANARSVIVEAFPSGMPSGLRMRRIDNGSTVNLYAHYGKWIVNLDTGYGKDRTHGNVRMANQSLAKDWEVAEKFTRRVLGRLAGLESSAMSGVRVGSQTVSARRGVAGETQLNLREWSAARGVALHLNMGSSMASFTVNGKTVVVPLASNKIKVGSQWTSADNISLLHDGEWFVPQTLLNAVL